jgi:hypothetical protein
VPKIIDLHDWFLLFIVNPAKQTDRVNLSLTLNSRERAHVTMNIHCVVARPKAGYGFVGRCIRENGHPRGAGKLLWDLYHTVFDRDILMMQSVLIDRHPAGWLTINGDWSQPIGYVKSGGARGPQCFCHGDCPMPRWDITERNAVAWKCEFAYLLFRDPTGGPRMRLLASYCIDGSKFVGLLGNASEGVTWRQVQNIGLNGVEPNWQGLEDVAVQWSLL